MYVSKRVVSILLKDDLVLWVNPTKIHFQVTTTRPGIVGMKEKFSRLNPNFPFKRTIKRQALRINNALESFVIDARKYQEAKPLSSQKKFKRIGDLVDNRRTYKNSHWYDELVTALQQNGFARHKKIIMHSEQEIENFIQSYALNLIDGLERDGYDLNKGGKLGRALIGEDGSIHKSSSGSHRFYAANKLGVTPIPLIISGVHEDWYRRHIGSRYNIQNLRSELEKIQQNHI